MVTRDHRIAEFSTDTPADGAPMQLLCEDHAGTYVLPFACQWTGGAWHNVASGAAIDVRVVGWRAY